MLAVEEAGFKVARLPWKFVAFKDLGILETCET
jgi:hypothetical protein